MRFHRLDLNLLVALDALLAEASVSLAADRIGLSQSATSSALGRLREYFEDDLLTLKGRKMVLTQRGEELVEPVRAVLQQVRTTIAVAPEFEPSKSDRTITIMASDYVTEVLLSRALNEFSKTAPDMRFEIRQMNDHIVESLERDDIDLLVTIDYAISPDHPSEPLYEDNYVVVGWESNPALSGGLDRKLYFELGHVTTKFGKARLVSFEEWFLRSQSMKRRVEVVAPSFLSVPYLVIGTDRIATVHESLAYRLAEHLPLKIMPLPFDLPGVRLAAQWDKSSDGDKAIRWVVEELKRHAKSVTADVRNAGAVTLPALGPAEMARQYQVSMGARTRH